MNAFSAVIATFIKYTTFTSTLGTVIAAKVAALTAAPCLIAFDQSSYTADTAFQTLGKIMARAANSTFNFGLLLSSK